MIDRTITAGSEARIAFLGIGLMGERQARVLLKAGFRVTAWNRSRDKAERLLPDGAIIADTAAEAARGAAVVITMLSDGLSVADVLFAQGVADALSPGAIVIDMSSIGADEAKAHAAALAERGIAHLDAPVSGGTKGAETGTLAIMCGGAEDVFQAVGPLLSAMGRPALIGPHGSGQLAKTANQMIVGTTIGVVAEALMLAKRGGADPVKVIDALAGGFADGTILRVHGRRMAEQDFRISGRASTQLKDLRNALRVGRGVEAATPYTDLTAALFTTLIERVGDIDHSAIALEFMRPDEIADAG